MRQLVVLSHSGFPTPDSHAFHREAGSRLRRENHLLGKSLKDPYTPCAGAVPNSYGPPARFALRAARRRCFVSAPPVARSLALPHERVLVPQRDCVPCSRGPRKNNYICGCSSAVERFLAKEEAVGANPITRSTRASAVRPPRACFACPHAGFGAARSTPEIRAHCVPRQISGGPSKNLQLN